MKNPALITAIASIIVALVAALSARASQRSAAKASTTTSRLDMEREAYERARAYDTETIRRQDVEIDELRAEIRDLRSQNRDLRQRVFMLEHVGPIKINFQGDVENDGAEFELDAEHGDGSGSRDGPAGAG